ncbi:MAG: hypothetical protein WBV69_23580, partial [Candidatus Sulfotelmatobacter sp.]
MAVMIEMQNKGDPRVRGEIVAILEHVLSDRAGEWRVSIVGLTQMTTGKRKWRGQRASSARCQIPIIGSNEFGFLHFD